MSIDPSLLKTSEFLETTQQFNYFNVKGEERVIELSANSLAFTYCQVPVVYRKGSTNKITVSFGDGSQKVVESLHLDTSTTQSLFSRENLIERVDVDLNL